MKLHHFSDDDLRILADFAIDQQTDHLYFKVIRQVKPEENYWSIDCRFAVSEDEINTYYDSLYIDSGRDNEPETYQMCWTQNRGGDFKIKPITSPLIVVHYFEEMCKKEHIKMN